MFRRHISGLAFVALLAVSISSAAADEPVDWKVVNRLRDEGFNRSQVMEILQHLTDSIGPRLTGSPAMRQANEWTRDELAGWGLENAHLEEWGPFGHGWSFSRTAVHLLQPREVPLMALPRASTPGTDGPVKGTAMKVEVEARFHKDDPMAYNTIAEIPGTDKRDEIVMVGAHLDSWHPAAGANAAVSPIFAAWLQPFHDLGANTVTANPNIGGTDHYSFDRGGLPGFQFIQDPLDYFPAPITRTWTPWTIPGAKI